jgi:hypothetical protein
MPGTERIPTEEELRALIEDSHQEVLDQDSEKMLAEQMYEDGKGFLDLLYSHLVEKAFLLRASLQRRHALSVPDFETKQKELTGLIEDAAIVRTIQAFYAKKQFDTRGSYKYFDETEQIIKENISPTVEEWALNQKIELETQMAEAPASQILNKKGEKVIRRMRDKLSAIQGILDYIEFERRPEQYLLSGIKI